MEKKVLKQYRDLLQETKDLERRIRSTAARIHRMETDEQIVSDTVTRGKKGKKPLGTVKVEGFPDMEYRRKKQQLYRYHKQLGHAKTMLDSLIAEAETFISSVDDSYIRQILRYRYLDGNSWEKVAVRMGGGNTADGCRMAAERFLQKN